MAVVLNSHTAGAVNFLYLWNNPCLLNKSSYLQVPYAHQTQVEASTTDCSLLLGNTGKTCLGKLTYKPIPSVLYCSVFSYCLCGTGFVESTKAALNWPALLFFAFSAPLASHCPNHSIFIAVYPHTKAPYWVRSLKKLTVLRWNLKIANMNIWKKSSLKAFRLSLSTIILPNVHTKNMQV